MTCVEKVSLISGFCLLEFQHKDVEAGSGEKSERIENGERG